MTTKKTETKTEKRMDDAVVVADGIVKIVAAISKAYKANPAMFDWIKEMFQGFADKILDKNEKSDE